MLLNPQELISPNEVQQIIRSTRNEEKKRFSEILTESGAGLYDCADTLSQVMQNGEANERIKATEIALKAHGALDPEAQGNTMKVEFVINGNVEAIQSVLIPR